MAAVTFDKLSYSQTLRSGGFTPEQAETSAHALDSALRDSVATKADVNDVKAELQSVKTELEHKIDASVAALEHRIDASVAASEHKIDASVAALEHKIDYSVELLRKEMVAQRGDMMKWLIPVLLGQAGLIVALSKLL